VDGAVAQTPVETYYVNDGRNDQYDQAFGELSNDLMGWVPWSRYGETAANGGHYYARVWHHPTRSFQDFMYDGALDLDLLARSIRQYCTLPSPTPPATPSVVVPFQPGHVTIEAGLPSFPVVDVAWWNATAGSAVGARRPVLYWPYRLNGGAMMVCLAGEPSPTGVVAPVAKSPRSVMLFNYYEHRSNFGTNKNRWHATVDGAPRDFTRPEAGWNGVSAGLQILGPSEQALEAGDLVVMVQENFDQDLWTSLQRTQEAEWFTRHQFAPRPPADRHGATFPAFDVGRAFLHGGSWGQIVAGTLALLQPRTYAGSANWILSDLAFGIGDYAQLKNHFDTYFGRTTWGLATDSSYTQFYTLVDLLGTRFDAPRFGRTGWDLAALCLDRRPNDLRVPVFGGVGDVDLVFPAAWSRKDGTLGSLATFHHPAYFRNREHGAAFGLVPSRQEYSTWNGDEWANLVAAASQPPAATNQPIAPTAPSPSKVYPDPYTHTLRHVHVPTPGQPDLLASFDLHAGVTPTFTKNGSIQWIGQGLYPGFHDSMRIADLDGDGRLEVVFGNLDGHVHVLEFAGSSDPSDPYRLLDEWRSPFLGHGLLASAVDVVDGKARMLFSDSCGQVWRIDAKKDVVDDYEVANGGRPIAAPDGHHLYSGATPILLVDDFDGEVAGPEIVALNRFLDFSMFTLDGAPAPGASRRDRDPHVVGPTHAAAWSTAPGAAKDLLVTAFDGNLWQMHWQPGPNQGSAWTTRRALDAWTGLALYHVVPFALPVAGSVHSFALLFGSNDDRNDAAPSRSNNVVQLWDLTTKTKVSETAAAADDVFGEGTSFSWLDRPAAGAHTVSFVISAGATLQKFTMDAGNVSSLTQVASRRVFPPVSVDVPFAELVSSVRTAALDDGTGAKKRCVVFASSDGRIYVTDENFEFLRLSDREFPTAPSPIGPTTKAVPWPSNRTLARTYTCDLVQTGIDPLGDNAALAPEFYFAEYAVPVARDLAAPPADFPHYRIGNLVLGASGNTWHPYVQPAVNDMKNAIWERNLPSFNRRLICDSDGPHRLKARIFAETGTAFLDSSLTPARVREFQTSSFGADFLFNGLPPNTPFVARQGGRVFELPANRNSGKPYRPNQYGYLGAFTVPTYSGMPYTQYSSTGSAKCWWYPKVNPAAFPDGQIADFSQSADLFSLGTATSHGAMTDAAGQLSQHVVVGTDNGFVFAIRPGAPAADGGLVASSLDYATQNLGSFVVGLDVGNLDGDADEEVVAGTWIDDGTFVDWNSGETKKNRGHLVVLDPRPATHDFAVTSLDGDDLCGPGQGIGSGVTGVKIDDVDGDGTKEIWCSDAAGHLYLFSQHAAQPTPHVVPWYCLFRSDDLCPYPGFYNQIFPVKDAQGHTVRLVVVAPGYVLGFDVHWQSLP
jgi:hypothetical protein